MSDKNCNYYYSKGIGSSDKSYEACVAPMRYGGKLEVEDIEELENNYRCNCNDHTKCFWHSQESRLKNLTEKK